MQQLFSIPEQLAMVQVSGPPLKPILTSSNLLMVSLDQLSGRKEIYQLSLQQEPMLIHTFKPYIFHPSSSASCY
uniref:Uncharacterized protein n=1 Tax=Sphaerodactylus townsendi TaxID=933632 RepID=A0ACB8G850_9SAUR